MKTTIEKREVSGCVDRSLGRWHYECRTWIVNGTEVCREVVRNVASSGHDMRPVLEKPRDSIAGQRAWVAGCRTGDAIADWCLRHPEAFAEGRDRPDAGLRGAVCSRSV